MVSGDLISSLAEKVKATTFRDALNSWNDPVLLGPPTVEFAPYAKVPSNRSRKDGRQGTIDQDQEFIAFLESLTQPVPKPAPIEDLEEQPQEEVTITPLVQYLKDKKANKVKETPSRPSKHAKGDKGAKAETKEDKSQAKKLLKRADKDKDRPAEKKASKAKKATKEAVKIATKQAAGKQAKAAAKEAGSQPPDTQAEGQRDRGKAPPQDSGGRRRGGKSATTADSAAKDEQSLEEVSSTGSPAPSKQASTGKGHQESQKHKSTAAQIESAITDIPPAPAAKPPKQSQAKAGPVNPSATQAFLKHANPSQGVTEALIQSTFSAFGDVVNVEIDRRKGFGYVDFATPEGLQRAIAASPVTVAQSQVVVLERRNPPSSQGKGKATADSSQQGSSSPTPSSGRSGKSGGRSRGRGRGRGPKGDDKGDRGKQ